MDKIEEQILSYFDKLHQRFRSNEVIENFHLTSVSKVRTSRGHNIVNYRDLVKNVSIIAGMNSKYDVFFRGQSKDFKDRNNRTVIYPTICRPNKVEDGSYKRSIQPKTIVNRYRELIAFSDYIKKKSDYRNNYYEYYFALIQHYQLLHTPLIDVTQSLRAASSFALEKSNTGFLYIFGLPYLQGSISHFIDHNMVLVKLQSVCPADANRPHFQEGYLVGRLPFYPKKEAGDNLARRLLAKFYLDNTEGDFWDSDFTPMPNSVLYPINDECEKAFQYHYKNHKTQ